MNNVNSSDEILLKEIKKSSQNAFNSLFNKYWDQSYQRAYKLLLDEDLAKDAVQEVFFDIWNRRNSLEITNISGFLYKAIRYQSLKHLQKRNLLDVHEKHFQNLLKVNDVEEQIMFNQLQEKLSKTLESFPDKYKEVFTMSRFQNLSNKEIAEKLSLSQRTVEWYLYTVLKHLKTTLGFLLLTIIYLFFKNKI